MGIKFLKYLMFFLNFLIFLGGLCLLGIGAWIAADSGGFKQLISAYAVIYTGANIVLGMGLLLFLVGFLGCCGAIQENKCFILTYFILILLIFAIELYGILLILFFKKHLREEILLKELESKYNWDDSHDLFSKAWNQVMLVFSCCGLMGPGDFANVTALQVLPLAQRVPLICCKRNRKGQHEILNKEKCLLGDPRFRNNQGCYKTLKGHFEKYIRMIGVIGASVLLVEILEMLFSICLLKKLWKTRGSLIPHENSIAIR